MGFKVKGDTFGIFMGIEVVDGINSGQLHHLIHINPCTIK